MENPLSLTNYWLKNIVIGLDLCPFARIPFLSGLIRIRVCEEESEEEQYQSFVEECESLLLYGPEKMSTTLIAYPKGNKNFTSFNDFVGEMENSLIDHDLSDTFQVVVFHPKFIFDGLEFDDLANYVNRSPYPLVHIIRVDEMNKALKSLSSGEPLSFLNEKKLKALAPSEIKELFYYLELQ